MEPPWFRQATTLYTRSFQALLSIKDVSENVIIYFACATDLKFNLYQAALLYVLEIRYHIKSPNIFFIRARIDIFYLISIFFFRFFLLIIFVVVSLFFPSLSFYSFSLSNISFTSHTSYFLPFIFLYICLSIFPSPLHSPFYCSLYVSLFLFCIFSWFDNMATSKDGGRQLWKSSADSAADVYSVQQHSEKPEFGKIWQVETGFSNLLNMRDENRLNYGRR